MSVHEFYRVKALIALEQVNTTEWSKKNKNLNRNLMLISKIAMVGWSGVVNFHGMQMRSCDEHPIYFRR